MAADSIEREILIEASAEVVWGVITEPEQISRWFSDEAEVQARAGAAGTLTWRPGGRGGNKEADMIVAIRVVDAEPYRRFSFRWGHPRARRQTRATRRWSSSASPRRRTAHGCGSSRAVSPP